MKMRDTLAVFVILLAGCSASHTSALPGVQYLAPQGGVNPFNLYKGNVIHKYSLPHPGSVPLYLATGADKNVWFTESNAARIGKITPNGVIAEYPIPSGGFGYDIAAGASGTLWFSEFSASTIGKITTAGQVTEFRLPTGKSATGGIAKGPDGNMWFTDSNSNRIGQITPTGTVTEYPLPTAGANPLDIVAGPDGNLWFVEGANTSQIGKMTTTGVITEYLGSGSYLTQIAAGADGNLYAGYRGGIERITTSGVITAFPGIGSVFVNDIILGPDKQMWLIASPYKMVEFNPKTQMFSNELAPDSLSYVVGLTVGGDGDVWITAGDDNKILVYEEEITTIGIRLNGELSITDPTYGFELGYAKGTGTTTQTISLTMGESVTFKNLDTIPHSAAFLGNATPSPSTWPATFTGSTTQSPAFTAIGTTGFATGSLNPNQQSPVYETGSPGFYMIGCQYHYVSNMMRTVIIVH